MSKRTPSPWIIDQKSLSLQIYGGPGKNRFVCSLETDEFSPPDEAMPDARLIVAAPDLLKALKICRNELVQNETANEPGGAMDRALKKAIQMADEAIAKVEGR